MRDHRMDGSDTMKGRLCHPSYPPRPPFSPLGRGEKGGVIKFFIFSPPPQTAAAKKCNPFGAGTRLLNNEQGQSTTATFPFVALLLVLLLTLAVFVVKVRTAQVSVAAAARACARQTVETLDPARGMEQGRQVGLNVLATRHLNPDRAEVQVIPLGTWDRHGQVECRVRYTVNLRGMPFMTLVSPKPEIQLTAAYRVQIEPYKSRWEGP